MIKSDPIIAVKDVALSSAWYQQVFGLRNAHGGKDFAVLVSEDDEVVLCLHKWGAHDHPTMTNPSIAVGNGLLLYLRADNMEVIRQNIERIGGHVEKDIHFNSNSLRDEFSLRDLDGYYLTVTEFHRYEG
jgi:predicted enzyme related to lactoylglutathione lyase